MIIRYFRKSHNTVYFGGLFELKQWISSSIKHDTVPRVISLIGNNANCGDKHKAKQAHYISVMHDGGRTRFSMGGIPLPLCWELSMFKQ